MKGTGEGNLSRPASHFSRNTLFAGSIVGRTVQGGGFQISSYFLNRKRRQNTSYPSSGNVQLPAVFSVDPAVSTNMSRPTVFCAVSCLGHLRACCGSQGPSAGLHEDRTWDGFHFHSCLTLVPVMAIGRQDSTLCARLPSVDSPGVEPA